MSEKTTENKVKVEVTAADGHVEVFTGDTAIVFTVKKGDEFMDGKAKMMEANAAYVGRDIPEPIFAETIGSLVGSLIQHRNERHPLLAAFQLHNVSQILEAHSKKMVSGTSLEEKEKDLDEAIDNLVKAILR